MNLLLTLVGLVFIAPALYWLWVSFVHPLQVLITWSGQNINILTPDKAEFVGTVNFERLLNDPSFSKTLTFTCLLIGGRVLAVVIVPPLLGWTLSRFGRGLRITLRLLLTLPLVFFAPIVTTVSWRIALNPQFGIFPNQTALSSATSAPATIQLIDFLTSFGIACALGVFAYVIAFRPLGGEGARRGTRRGFIALWLTSLALAVTTTLQSVTLVLYLTNGGPANATRTLPLWFYTTFFRNFQTGQAAALNVLMLIPIALLGLIIGLYVAFSNIAVIHLRPHRFKVLGRSVAFLILAVLFTGALVAILANLIPVLWVYATSQGAVPSLPTDVTLPQLILNTITPQLSPILLQLPLIYLAALGIGALRPLGRFSEWLLIPFSPFLFVTIYLLSPAWYVFLRNDGLLSTAQGVGTAAGLLNVGALFILTLFFKGQTALWDRENHPGLGGFLRVVVLPSLPLLLFIFLASLGVAAQDADWANIVNQQPINYTASQAIASSAGRLTPNSNDLRALVTQIGTIFNLVYFIALFIFSAFYVDRLALGTPATLRDALEQINPPAVELQ